MFGKKCSSEKEAWSAALDAQQDYLNMLCEFEPDFLVPDIVASFWWEANDGTVLTYRVVVTAHDVAEPEAAQIPTHHGYAILVEMWEISEDENTEDCHLVTMLGIYGDFQQPDEVYSSSQTLEKLRRRNIRVALPLFLKGEMKFDEFFGVARSYLRVGR
jgi:hypothetical protein